MPDDLSEDLPIGAALASWIAARCELTPDEVSRETPVVEFGLSSVDAVELAGRLERRLGRPLPATLLWEYPTINAIETALAGEPETLSSRAPEPGPIDASPIAVIGLGCRFPGGANGPDALWRLLLDGGDAVRTVPPDRWPAAGAELLGPGRCGGFLDDVARFDAEFFGIAPGEARLMDPQQRLLLEVVWDALAHAALDPAGLRGSRTGVYAGLSAGEYAHLTAAELDRAEGWTATGGALSIVANRVSYLLDLRGPSLAVDTACSSSLVAIHLAARDLRRGETDLALAGGVSLMLHPALTIAFRRAGGLATGGHCRPFDAAADGIVRGEGCGVVVLKRLADAVRDGDRVLALLRGGAVNSDGRSNGLVAPNPRAQEALLRQAYADAGFAPSTTDYIEAHGTGTPLGDPIEAGALGVVCGTGRPAGEPLLIGSVKSHLGHLEAAAGVAGFITAVLALYHGTVPPTIHHTRLNPRIGPGLRVAVQAEPLPARDRPARAGVSAFGFGGTNAHLVLEAYPCAPAGPDADDAATDSLRVGRMDGPTERDWAVRSAVCVLTDKDLDRVREQAGAVARWLARSGDGPTGVAGTLARRGERGAVRAVVVARDRAELMAGLSAAAAGRADPRSATGTGRRAAEPGVWVFSGYGTQWPGMGLALLDREPAFAAAVEKLEPDFRSEVGMGLREGLGGGSALGVRYCQPLIFALQVALAELWHSYGLRPGAVIGHSMGEVAAAVVAGGLSTVDGLRLIAHRGRLLAEAGPGTMLVVELSEDEFAEFAEGLPDTGIAVVAAPDQLVVTGSPAAVAALADRVTAAGRLARSLTSEGAGHSPAVDPLLPLLRVAMRGLRPGSPRVPIYSTVTAEPPRLDVDYWLANLRQPVRFTDAVGRAAADGFGFFLEISPHPVLVRPIGRTLAAAAPEPLIVGSLRRDDPDAFARGLATVCAHGHRVPGVGEVRILDLPAPPWRGERHWVDPPAPGPVAARLPGEHVEVPGEERHLWRLASLGPDAPRLLHRLPGGAEALPLAGLVELAVTAAAGVTGRTPEDLELTAAGLVGGGAYPAEASLTTTLAPDRSGGWGVAVHAPSADGGWTLLGEATIRPAASGPAASRPAPSRPAPSRPATSRPARSGATPAARVPVASGVEPRPAEAAEIRPALLRTLLAPAWREQRATTAEGPAAGPPLPPTATSALASSATVLGAADDALVQAALADPAATPTAAGQDVVLIAGPAATAPDPAAAQALALAAIDAAAQGARRLWLVTRGGAAVGPDEPGAPDLAFVRGLVRTLAFEQPAVHATWLDLDPAAEPAAQAADLWTEVHAGAGDDEVAWRAGRRWVARLAPAALPPRGPRPSVRPAAAYLLTGGYGGIGLRIAHWLAAAGAGRLVLSGRNGPSPQSAAALDALRRSGVDVQIVPGDIADDDVAGRLVSAARAGGLPLAGVVHAAGVLRDRLLPHVGAEDLAQVWAPKVHGALRLHTAVTAAGVELDWWVSFSSAAALLGSPGQAAYAGANAWLDAFARWQRAQGVPAHAVNWGVWARIGGATGVRLPGLDPIEPDEGVAALAGLLRRAPQTVGVLRFDPAAALAAFPGAARLPFFAEVAGEARDATPVWDGADRVRALPPAEAVRVITDRLAERVATVLGIDRPPPVDARLTDAGLDSLAAIRVKGLVEADFGTALPTSVLVGGASLADVAGALAHALGVPADGFDRPAVIAPRDAAERDAVRLFETVLGDAVPGIDWRLDEGAEAVRVRIAELARLDLDAEAFRADPTPRALAVRLRAAEQAEVGAAGPVRPLRAQGGRPPLFLAHPAGGSTYVYRQLVAMLDAEQPVYGLERLAGAGPVAERAERYVSLIREVRPAGPYRLGGWSFGGAVAFEMARRLAAAGESVDALVLIDAGLPVPMPPDRAAALLTERFLGFVRYLGETYRVPIEVDAARLQGLAEDEQFDLVLEQMSAAGLTRSLPPAVLRHQLDSHRDTRALDGYRPGPYDGPVTLYRSTRPTPWAVRDERYEHTDAARGWDRHCADLRIVPVAAHHLNLLDPPAVEVIAADLRRLL